ncbi:hypothetical protein PV646_18900 [Streptomyces sp. ID05-26A]|nr:hypothetical protein [Streptomyces sp. ID05-26A]
MSDRDRFVCHHERFGDAVVGEPSPWVRGPLADLPVLSALPAAAAVTPVSVAPAVPFEDMRPYVTVAIEANFNREWS